MGLLVEGQWKDQWYDTKSTNGQFKRQDSIFRHQITQDGPFQAEPDRYHLYVSNACPWAHRTLIFRKLKQLEDVISVSTVHPDMLTNGWEFREDAESEFHDHVLNRRYMYEVYTQAKPDYTGRVTVPVLWDKKTQAIVNNESSEIIRMFNSAFNDLTGNDLDFYPAALQKEIDEMNARIYDTINNGVYRCGFATTQTAYEEAYEALFESLDWIEQRLQQSPYLCGVSITEADWRLFTTLVRFDAVYVGHFKTNKKRIVDYPAIWRYVRTLYNQPGIAETVKMDQIKRHYYYSHTTINPTQVIPVGPVLDFSVD